MDGGEVSWSGRDGRSGKDEEIRGRDKEERGGGEEEKKSDQQTLDERRWWREDGGMERG